MSKRAKIKQEIENIEKEIEETPYNKSTEEHIGRLKAKLSKLKEELKKQQEESGGGGGYDIPKQGDATVSLIGFPSVGKSTLLNTLTNAESETASYSFTTLEVIPGMLEYKGARIQLLDLPGLIEGASHGRGRGSEVLSVLRSTDLILVLVDVFEPQQYKKLMDELYSNGVRPDRDPPNVKIERKERGGIQVRKSGSLNKETVKKVCREHGLVNVSIVLGDSVTIEELNDAIAGNRAYIDTLVSVNKLDIAEQEQIDNTREELRKQGVENAVGISAEEKLGLETLKERIYDSLNLIKIYLKPRGKDKKDPMIIKEESTVEDVAKKIHSNMDIRNARVWGKSVKHNGQQVGKTHELKEEDELTIIFS